MKNLNELGLFALSNEEASEINGGSWIKRAWNDTVDALESAYQWCKERGVDIMVGRA